MSYNILDGLSNSPIVNGEQCKLFFLLRDNELDYNTGDQVLFPFSFDVEYIGYGNFKFLDTGSNEYKFAETKIKEEITNNHDEDMECVNFSLCDIFNYIRETSIIIGNRELCYSAISLSLYNDIIEKSYFHDNNIVFNKTKARTIRAYIDMLYHPHDDYKMVSRFLNNSEIYSYYSVTDLFIDYTEENKNIKIVTLSNIYFTTIDMKPATDTALIFKDHISEFADIIRRFLIYRTNIHNFYYREYVWDNSLVLFNIIEDITFLSFLFSIKKYLKPITYIEPELSQNAHMDFFNIIQQNIAKKIVSNCLYSDSET